MGLKKKKSGKEKWTPRERMEKREHKKQLAENEKQRIQQIEKVRMEKLQLQLQLEVERENLEQVRLKIREIEKKLREIEKKRLEEFEHRQWLNKTYGFDNAEKYCQIVELRRLIRSEGKEELRPQLVKLLETVEFTRGGIHGRLRNEGYIPKTKEDIEAERRWWHYCRMGYVL
jgi:hypothetical protein